MTEEWEGLKLYVAAVAAVVGGFNGPEFEGLGLPATNRGFERSGLRV